MTPEEQGALGEFLSAVNAALSPYGDQADTFGAGAYVVAAGVVKVAIAALNDKPVTAERLTKWARILGSPPDPPPGHTGELAPNHIDAAGQVVAAFHPGDCITCHGHVGADGVFTPAGAA